MNKTESLDASRPDVLGIARQNRKATVWFMVIFALLLVAMAVSTTLGAVSISPTETLQVIQEHLLGQKISSLASIDAIIWQVRLPRVLMAACVGMGLSVCGLVLQAMIRNVLAEPYILGISSGASSGAAAAILFGVGSSLIGQYALQSMAFLGALLASLLVFFLAKKGGNFSSARLLLAGVAVGYALNSLTSLLIFASANAEGSRSVMFWLLGSLASITWGPALDTVVLATAIATVVFGLLGRHLDVLTAGDETAQTMGISADKLRIILLVIVALCVGTLVSAVGSIGFVGLVVPHLARQLVGASHRRIIPLAAVMGALLLVIADLISRLIFSPQEMPIGILTAVIGTPFLLSLIRHAR